MFNSLAYEINTILNGSGKEFAVFMNYNIEQEQGDALLDKFANIGVLYVNYGEIRLLENNQGLKGSMQLDLLMSIDDGVKVDDLVQAPLQALIDNANGKLKDGDGNAQYVLSFHLPTTNGDIKYTEQGKKYLLYSLPIDVFLSNGLLLGESVKIYLDGNEIKNVSSATLTPIMQLDSRTMANSNKTLVTGLATAWSVQIVLVFNPSDTLHQAIYKCLLDEPYKKWTITLGDGEMKGTNGTNTTKSVILHDGVSSFNRAQPTFLTFNASETL